MQKRSDIDLDDVPVDYPRHVHQHTGGNAKAFLAIAIVVTAVLTGVGGLALHKLYDVSDTLARMEILMTRLSR